MDFELIQTAEELTVVVTEDQPTEIISEGLMGPPGLRGERGDPGPPGPNTIGNLVVQITNPMDGDVLTIAANKVINISGPSLTDGGNF